MPRLKVFHQQVATVAAIVLATTACSGSGATLSSTPSAESSAASPATKVTVAVTGAYTNLAPIFIAANNGYYADEGLDVNVQVIKPETSGPAMSSGSVNFIGSASTDVINLAAKKIPVLAVSGFEHFLTLDVVVSNKAVAARHLTKDMPLESKFAALKGMTVGTTGPGTSTQVLLNWIMTQAGLDPVRDVTSITAATQSDLAALMESGNADAFLAGPPASIQEEAKGAGITFIRSSIGEIPFFGKDFLYETLFTQKDYAEKNPDVVKRVNRALLRATKFMIDNDSAAVIKAMGEPYKTANQQMLALTLDGLKKGLDDTGQMRQTQWDNVVEFFKLSGQDVSEIDTNEGTFWTNQYLP
jgi:NitT/TauT family transport system substrate-binding protein